MPSGEHLKKHGMCKSREYESWSQMRQRCKNKNHKYYSYYGGRGISICDKWDTFGQFYLDMGNRPDGMELDRIDSNGNYCKENCRWVTRSENMKNRRSPFRADGLPRCVYKTENGKFIYCFRVDGRMIHSNRFSNPIDARKEYELIHKEWFGKEAMK